MQNQYTISINIYALNCTAIVFKKQKPQNVHANICRHIQNKRCYYNTLSTKQINWTKLCKMIEYLNNITNKVGVIKFI